MRIAIDIGGTKTRIAILNANDFGDPKIISTPEKYDDAIAAIKSTVLATALSENSPNIESVVVGKRGTISHDGEIALHDTNFHTSVIFFRCRIFSPVDRHLP